jgi:hypothetical protein
MSRETWERDGRSCVACGRELNFQEAKFTEVVLQKFYGGIAPSVTMTVCEFDQQLKDVWPLKFEAKLRRKAQLAKS